MVTWIPISSPFVCNSISYIFDFNRRLQFQVRFADRFVDPALGFAAGYNFFALQAALVPFEVVAFNLVLQYWTDKIPLVAVICFVLLSYAYVGRFALLNSS